MQLGILNCGQPPESVSAVHGNYAVWFENLFGPHGINQSVWDVENLIFPDDPYDADAWLVTGSPHGAYEAHAFIEPLEEFIRDIHAAQVPMVGICFGHQIIAQAMGGKVEKFEGGWEFGRRSYETASLGEVHLTAFHQDQVVELPPGAEVVATTPGCQYAGLAYGHACITLQPHPEIDPVILADYISRFRADKKDIPAFMIEKAALDLSLPTQELEVGAWLAEILLQGN